MFSKRSTYILLILGLFALLFATHAFADDRINMPPYHFGGDTLYCESETGCTLLNLTGHFVWNWPEEDISAAFEQLDLTGVNTLVGEGEGTFGQAWLWVIPTSETNGNKTLCFQGFDEWGKQNEMCFDVTTDWIYQQAPLPNPVVPVVIADCSPFSVGDGVHRIGTSGGTSYGHITQIHADVGTATVDVGKGGTYTESCDNLEYYSPG